jgi:hypothetical protein
MTQNYLYHTLCTSFNLECGLASIASRMLHIFYTRAAIRCHGLLYCISEIVLHLNVVLRCSCSYHTAHTLCLVELLLLEFCCEGTLSSIKQPTTAASTTTTSTTIIIINNHHHHQQPSSSSSSSLATSEKSQCV